MKIYFFIDLYLSCSFIVCIVVFLSPTHVILHNIYFPKILSFLSVKVHFFYPLFVFFKLVEAKYSYKWYIQLRYFCDMLHIHSTTTNLSSLSYVVVMMNLIQTHAADDGYRSFSNKDLVYINI